MVTFKSEKEERDAGFIIRKFEISEDKVQTFNLYNIMALVESHADIRSWGGELFYYGCASGYSCMVMVITYDYFKFTVTGPDCHMYTHTHTHTHTHINLVDSVGFWKRKNWFYGDSVSIHGLAGTWATGDITGFTTNGRVCQRCSKKHWK